MSLIDKKMMHDRDMEAATWSMMLAEGQLDVEEQREFDAWCTNPANLKALEEALRVWRAADQAAEMPEVVRVRAIALESFRRANGNRWMQTNSHRWAWLGGIAATLVITIAGYTMLQAPTTVFVTGIGERRVAMLEDGSRLSLDAGTEVDVQFQNDRRKLTLVRGRAKFDVAHNPLRPFSVRVGDKEVVAIGTSFSVELLQSQAHVLLYEGRVAVLDAKKEKPVLQKQRDRVTVSNADASLIPGRELVVAVNSPSATAIIEPVNTSRSLSWESGQLSFEDEVLSSAVERVNRYSKRKVVISDPSIAHMHVNGIVNVGDVDAFVEAVTAFNPVRAISSPNEIKLVR